KQELLDYCSKALVPRQDVVNCVDNVLHNITTCQPVLSYGLKHKDKQVLSRLSSFLGEEVFVQLLINRKSFYSYFTLLPLDSQKQLRIMRIKENEPLIAAAWTGNAEAIERLLTDWSVATN